MTPSTPLFLLAAVVFSVRAVSNWPIIAPAAGDDVPVNETYTIRWINDTEGPVSITLMYTDSPGIILTSSTENTGSFEWTPVTVLAGDADYFLKICDVTIDSSECSYTSNGRFHIVSSSTTSTTTNPPAPTTTATTSTSSTTTPLTITTPPTTTTTPTMATPSPPEDDNKGSSGLGTASVVGLSVGTTLGTLFLAAAAFILYKKSKKSKPAKQGSAPGFGPGPDHAGEHPSEYYHPGAAGLGGEGHLAQQHDRQYPAQGYLIQQKQNHPSELDSWAVHQLDYVASLIHPISSETGLRYFERDTAENAIQRLVDEAHNDKQLRVRLSTQGSVTFESYTSRAGKVDAVSESVDQSCIYRRSDGQNVPAPSIEYKAPHKLTRDEVVSGLREEIQPERDVINKGGKGFAFASRRLTAAVVTQLFSYMVDNGIQYGYVCTGETFIFLHIPDNPSIVYYSVCIPNQDVALRSPPPSKAWYDRADGLDIWPIDFEDVLRDIPENERKVPRKSPYRAQRWKGFTRSPIKTRSRCRPENSNAPLPPEQG
ncbi:hypothetical protein F4803DRAFT_556560 [Xylaria telfairii]|nr:hypothetical protein F4803DRAFT_556560 [Xylaria telfairii]